MSPSAPNSTPPRPGLAATLIARLKAPSTVYVVASVLSRVGSFVLIPLYVRRLTTAEYGEYALAQTVLIIGPSVLALGLANAVTKFQFEGGARESIGRVGAIARGSVLVTLGLALVCVLAVVTFHPHGAGLRGTWGLTCVLVAVAGNAIHSIPGVYFRNAQRAYAASALQLLELFLVAALGWLFVGPLARGLTGALEATAAAYAICALLGLVLMSRWPADRLTLPLLREGLTFSAPLVPHYIATWLQGAADRWVMGFGGHGPQLGPYSLASQLSSPGVMITTAWNVERSARTGELFKREGLGGVERQMPRIRRSYIVATAVAIGATLACLPVFPFLAGRMFPEAALYLGPILVIGAIEALYHPHQHVAYYSGHSKPMAALATAAAAVAVAFSLLLVPPFGVWGALAARAASTLLKTAGMWWVAARIFRQDEKRRRTPAVSLAQGASPGPP